MSAAAAETPAKKQSIFFSQKTTEWATPAWLYSQLDEIHHFTLDVCATKENAKCERFYTQEDDGLSKSWAGETCWMNPPYGKQIKFWVKKALDESKAAKVVCLLPVRTDTSWFQDYVKTHKKSINFLRGRLRFSSGDVPTNNAPFPSMVVVFDARPESEPADSPSERLAAKG